MTIIRTHASIIDWPNKGRLLWCLGEDEDEEEEETEATSAGEEKPKKKRKPPEEKPDAKTEAERRIESIRSEVEKVLDKLGQMEIES